jgi:hypothetical protein
MMYMPAMNQGFNLNYMSGMMDAESRAFGLADANYAAINEASRAAMTGEAENPMWQRNMFMNEKARILAGSQNDLNYKMLKQMQESIKKHGDANSAGTFNYLM